MNTELQSKINQFFSKWPARTWPAGQIIIQAFDEPQGVYFIESGAIRQYATDYRGEEMVVNVFHDSTFMPMSWAINDVKNEYCFETIEESVLRLAPKEEVLDFIHQNPDVSFDLLSRVYSGMDGILMRTVHLMGSSAYVRILYELSILVKRAGDPSDQKIHLPLKEYELAAYSGLSKETISREFKKLKDRGIVEISSKGITIPSPAKLLEELEKQN